MGKNDNLVNRLVLATALSLGIVAGKDLISANLTKPIQYIKESISNLTNAPPEYPRPFFVPEYDPASERDKILEAHASGNWDKVYSRFYSYMNRIGDSRHYNNGPELIIDMADRKSEFPLRRGGLAVTYLLESAIRHNDKELFFKGAEALSGMDLDKDTASILDYFNSRAKLDWKGLVAEVNQP
ncbi:MAG TPA: hypothetical protein VMC07_03075 [Candidatus Omnitrophota bacterium]|nr:hypothetical protein [Candidatus Omnitrophota bacterium]